jgi:glycerol-3-phosphate dehydrogenase
MRLEPALGRDRLKGSLTYYDGVTDDARLTVANILDAKAHGAVIATYTEVTGFRFDGAGKDRITGAIVQDALDPGRGATITAKVTINAAGAWMDHLLAKSTPNAPAPPRVVPSKGVHLVIDGDRLPVHHAIVMSAPQDQRVVFALPTPHLARAGVARTVIGTTDTRYEGERDQLGPDAADVTYLLACANDYFPNAKLTPDDVIATWTGLRPLMAPKSNETNMSAISREHTLFMRPGLVSIAGGKLTTYRRMAAELVDAALKQVDGGRQFRPCDTATALLPGGEGIRADEHAVKGPDKNSLGPAFASLNAETYAHLLGTYGGRVTAMGDCLAAPGALQRLDEELPFLMAEVDWAVSEEEAQRLDDVLGRRLPLILWARDQGLGCAETVADRMATKLGWSDARRQAEVTHYRRQVALSQQFRPVPSAH